MKTVISAKLKLNTTPEQFVQLRTIQLAYRDACNFVSKYAFEQSKMSDDAHAAHPARLGEYGYPVRVP